MLAPNVDLSGCTVSRRPHHAYLSGGFSEVRKKRQRKGNEVEREREREREDNGKRRENSWIDMSRNERWDSIGMKRVEKRQMEGGRGSPSGGRIVVSFKFMRKWLVNIHLSIFIVSLVRGRVSAPPHTSFLAP